MAQTQLAVLVRGAMGRRDLSYRDVADASGLGLSYCHRIARGRVAQPSPGSLRKLAGALDVPYTQLLRAAGYL